MISFVRRAVTNKTGVPLQATGKVVTACKQLLEIQGIFDVDCELKESIACRHGPGLLHPYYWNVYLPLKERSGSTSPFPITPARVFEVFKRAASEDYYRGPERRAGRPSQRGLLNGCQVLLKDP